MRLRDLPSRRPARSGSIRSTAWRQDIIAAFAPVLSVLLQVPCHRPPRAARAAAAATGRFRTPGERAKLRATAQFAGNPTPSVIAGLCVSVATAGAGRALAAAAAADRLAEMIDQGGQVDLR